jgi:hypothetical protein
MLMTTKTGGAFGLTPDKEEKAIELFATFSNDKTQLEGMQKVLQEQGIPGWYVSYLQAEGSQRASQETPVGKRVRAFGEGVQRGMQFGQEVIPTEIAEPDSFGGYRGAGQVAGTIGAAASLPGRAVVGGLYQAGKAIAGAGLKGVAAGSALASGGTEVAGMAGRAAREAVTGQESEDRGGYAYVDAAINAAASVGVDALTYGISKGMPKPQIAAALKKMTDAITRKGGKIAETFWENYSRHLNPTKGTAPDLPILQGPQALPPGPQAPRQLPQRTESSILRQGIGGGIQEVTPQAPSPGTSRPTRREAAQQRPPVTEVGPRSMPIEMPGAPAPPPPSPEVTSLRNIGERGRAMQPSPARGPEIVTRKPTPLRNLTEQAQFYDAVGNKWEVLERSVTRSNKGTVRVRNLETGAIREMEPFDTVQPFTLGGGISSGGVQLPPMP